MGLRKTTKLKYCSVPKGTNTTTLQLRGKPLHAADVMDIFVDSVNSPRLMYILDKMDLIKTVKLCDCVHGGSSAMTDTIHIVLRNDYLSVDKVMRAVNQYGGEEELNQFDHIVKTIIGLNYILANRSVFEVDVCVIEGNTAEAIEGKGK